MHFREFPLENPQLLVTNRYHTKAIATLNLFSNPFNISHKSSAVSQLVVSVNFNGNHSVFFKTVSAGSKVKLQK